MQQCDMKVWLSSKKFCLISIALAVWMAWFTFLGPKFALSNMFHHWQIAVTMAFASIIAGGTSIGGGAVAFPVFTKLLHVSPYDAKVFSLAIQSVGMGAAALVISLTGIRVAWPVILWASIGGVIGVGLGLGIAPLLPSNVVKMSFSLVLASFAITLLALNRGARECHPVMPIWTVRERAIAIGAGLLGGVMSGLVGNGIDILVFSAMVLLFRMSEKVATPTSVILMAVNALVGLAWQGWVFEDFTDPVRSYWLAAIPVVVVGAPLGAILCSKFRRETIANILIGLIFIELITSLILIPLNPMVICLSLGILLGFSYLNYWMYRTQFYAILPIETVEIEK